MDSRRRKRLAKNNGEGLAFSIILFIFYTFINDFAVLIALLNPLFYLYSIALLTLLENSIFILAFPESFHFNYILIGISSRLSFTAAKLQKGFCNSVAKAFFLPHILIFISNPPRSWFPPRVFEYHPWRFFLPLLSRDSYHSWPCKRPPPTKHRHPSSPIP